MQGIPWRPAFHGQQQIPGFEIADFLKIQKGKMLAIGRISMKAGIESIEALKEPKESPSHGNCQAPCTSNGGLPSISSTVWSRTRFESASYPRKAPVTTFKARCLPKGNTKGEHKKEEPIKPVCQGGAPKANGPRKLQWAGSSQGLRVLLAPTFPSTDHLYMNKLPKHSGHVERILLCGPHCTSPMCPLQ